METSLLEPEVKIISRETVKPSNPTPSHLRTFNLSMMDQMSMQRRLNNHLQR
ncbi:hypothetical protein KSS87_000442 [Heliosperma pusillum]|nr:hypothetical protein KSS87_000442 [Heliosperma pusillum]